MINKIVGVSLTILGAIGLILCVLGIFGSNIVNLNSWAMAILGLIFFLSGIGLLKRVSSD